MKRIALTAGAAGLAVLAVAVGIIVAGPPAEAQLNGDANCDGTVNAVDAALVLQFDAGIITSLPCAQNANVNGDGRANALDALLILQYVAGIIHSLPPTPSPTLQPGEAIALVVQWWPTAQFPYHDVMNFQPSTCVATWTGAHWEVNCEAGILGDHHHATFCVYEVTRTVGLC